MAASRSRMIRPEGALEPTPKSTRPSLTILATLGVIAALYLLRPILVPIALSILLACLLFPAVTLIRRALPIGPVGAAISLFLVLAVGGLYVASLTAESLVRAAETFPTDVERLAMRLSDLVNDAVRDHPFLSNVLPEPGTIDLLGYTNRELLLNSLSYRLSDLTAWVGHGVVVLFLVLFLLAEGGALGPRLVRFLADPEEVASAQRTLRSVTRKIRAYLVARTGLNLGLGVAVAAALWLLGIDFAVPLGVFAAVTNYIPYLGNIAAGVVSALVTLGQRGSAADVLLVVAVFLAIVTVEGYLIMPYVMGRSLDLNGTTVLVACLFWGFLWGAMGLIMAMPITVSLKLVFHAVPTLRPWAELMSRVRPESWRPLVPDDAGAARRDDPTVLAPPLAEPSGNVGTR